MKRGGKEGEKGRNRDGGRREGGREGKRKTRLDRMVENRGKVVPLRQPSPRHTGTFSHSFSVSSFACFPAPTGYNTSSTSPPTRQEAFCACTGIVYASLDNAARRAGTRYDSRRPRSVFRWVNGPRAPGETTGCWEKSQESSARGWGIYRCPVGTVITDPISRGWK